MDAKLRVIRINDLAKATDRTQPIGDLVRPEQGWIRAMREGLDLTLTELARRLGVTVPAVRSFERAEAEDRITLGSLRRVAAAMDCEVLYVLAPREKPSPNIPAADSDR